MSTLFHGFLQKLQVILSKENVFVRSNSFTDDETSSDRRFTKCSLGENTKDYSIFLLLLLKSSEGKKVGVKNSQKLLKKSFGQNIKSLFQHRRKITEPKWNDLDPCNNDDSNANTNNNVLTVKRFFQRICQVRDGLHLFMNSKVKHKINVRLKEYPAGGITLRSYPRKTFVI